MIATTSSGRRFGALASYLVRGRTGAETERVAWTAGRNLGTDDPELAAPLMQATARQSALVQVPVYHLTISFDHEDRVTPEQMQAVADRVLADLGLSEHQAVMVAHRDRAHAHVHVMVNRVHPETGVAWERWQDRPRIERTLRAVERELGLREVSGRLYQLDGREAPEAAPITPGERQQAERSGDPALPDRVRAHLPELRAARSWAELEERLSEHGLRLERKGQGLVVTDGEHQVKASRVARDLSLRRLEERFAAPFPGREAAGAPEPPREPLSPAVAEVAAAVREADHVAALRQDRFRVEQELSSLAALRHQFEGAHRALDATREGFDRALSRVYVDPEAARQSIREAASQLGAECTAAALREDPQRFGALRTVEQRRAFGLLVVADDSAARTAARDVAVRWDGLAAAEVRSATLAAEYVRRTEERFSEALSRVYRDPPAARAAFEQSLAHAGAGEATRTLAEHPDRLGALLAGTTQPLGAGATWKHLAERAREAVEARAPTSAALASAHAERAIGAAQGRRRELDDALGRAPSVDLLERAVGRAVDRLEPRELAQLRSALTAPQAAIAFKAREAVRDMLLGREEHER